MKKFTSNYAYQILLRVAVFIAALVLVPAMYIGIGLFLMDILGIISVASVTIHVASYLLIYFAMYVKYLSDDSSDSENQDYLDGNNQRLYS